MPTQAPITLALPSKYTPSASKANNSVASLPLPSLGWLCRTWTVTHSTLSMWRSARNVRITYKPLPSSSKGDGKLRIDDLVEYEPTDKSGSVWKCVEGVDTQAVEGGWNWRGKGWLFFVSSHWEVLGWGENTTVEGKTERWAVTWFAPTVFTKEGVDVYSDCAEGLSEELYRRIEEALRKLEAREVVEMTAKDMRAVEIRLPWTGKC
ncbi:hypothetical protein E4U43_002672 [Claviceps pusilla]|uniref:Uncharacterized protein n=1 Tax=Claviceps pusilla TaxID=123648 RepID=A0A9P7SV46_9HYPO|nr:hypothetical protein E4U43_002672 [Claviceps pusilla]